MLLSIREKTRYSLLKFQFISIFLFLLNRKLQWVFILISICHFSLLFLKAAFTHLATVTVCFTCPRKAVTKIGASWVISEAPLD